MIIDPEGDELNGIEASRAEAFATARDLLMKARGLDWRGCSLEVTDAAGKPLFMVAFADAEQARRV